VKILNDLLSIFILSVKEGVCRDELIAKRDATITLTQTGVSNV
jgi:hypothetical protein